MVMGPHAISRALSSLLAYGRYQYTINYGSEVQVRQLAPLIELEYWHGARN